MNIHPGVYWIWPPEAERKTIRMVKFRRSFSLPEGAGEYHGNLCISADSRYRLYVNGVYLGRGPCRSDLQHYVYERYGLTGKISAGRNLIAAEVLFFGNEGPAGEMHDRPGLIMWGEIRDEKNRVVCQIKSDREWKAKRDGSFRSDDDMPQKITSSFCLYATGFGEIVDGRKEDRDWLKTGFDDAKWNFCREVEPPSFSGEFLDPRSRKWLCPREIPVMDEIPRRFHAVIKSTRKGLDARFKTRINPGESLTFIVDAGHLATGYPDLIVEGGGNRKIRITYAEALTAGTDKLRFAGDLPAAAEVLGYYDTYLCSGKKSRYQPFLLRTFRFIKVEISSGKTPLTLIDFSYLFSAYPFSRKADFTSSDPDCKKLFDISFRTARLCAHEHYEDCPYHERLQYVGDTRLQALISYCICGESRLAKRAIEMFDYSRMPAGLTQSRYPSNCPQIIPPFSLIWIMMIEDYLMYTGDAGLAMKMETGIMSVLNWFEGHLQGGLAANLPYWNFVDWCPEWAHGVPPVSKSGVSTILNLQFIAALQSAGRIFEVCGKKEASGKVLTLSEALKKKIVEKCFSRKEGVFLDAPGKPHKSQHANIWAIITDAISGKEQETIADKILSDKEMAQSTYYHMFYLFQAFSKLGRYDKVYPLLDRWRNLIKKGFTTWPETPGRTRSDCHAWSAWIISDFITNILGIKPKKPGLQEVLIRPALGGLDFAKGKMPCGNGFIEVSWRRGKKGRFTISGRIPPGCRAEIVTPFMKRFKNVTGKFAFRDFRRETQ